MVTIGGLRSKVYSLPNCSLGLTSRPFVAPRSAHGGDASAPWKKREAWAMYAVLRVAKLKTMGEIGQLGKHNVTLAAYWVLGTLDEAFSAVAT